MKTLITLFVFLAAYIIINAEDSLPNYIGSTEGTITSIEKIGNGKRAHYVAQVDYNIDGTQYTTQVNLNKIPFVGTLSKVGNAVSLKYDPANPYLAQSASANFFATYGWYILILLGVIFSAPRILRMMKNQRTIRHEAS